MELLTVVKSVHKHSQIWDLAQAIRKTKGRNWMSPVLQGGFRAADLLRPRSRKAGTFCKHQLWSLPSKQMGWSSHVSEALWYLPKYLHSVHGASGSEVAIKGTRKFGTCGLFIHLREIESHTVCSFTVKQKLKIKPHRVLHTALTPPHWCFPNSQSNEYTRPQPLKGQPPYRNSCPLYYLCYHLDLTVVGLIVLIFFFFLFYEVKQFTRS